MGWKAEWKPRNAGDNTSHSLRGHQSYPDKEIEPTQENEKERRVGGGEGRISDVVWAPGSAIPDSDCLINFVVLNKNRMGSCSLHPKESWSIQELSLNGTGKTFRKQDEKKKRVLSSTQEIKLAWICMQ